MSRNVHKNFYHYFTPSKKRGSMCKAQNNKMKYAFYINDIVHSIYHSTSQLAFTGRWLYLFSRNLVKKFSNGENII